MLALVFATNRFHQYIYGLPVELETDHKPLETIFRKPLQHVPRRLQRMRMESQRFDVTVVYRRGTELDIADTLSRAYLPLKTNITEFDLGEQVSQTSSERDVELNTLEEVFGISDERFSETAEHTEQDLTLQQLNKCIQVGRPNERRNVP